MDKKELFFQGTKESTRHVTNIMSRMHNAAVAYCQEQEIAPPQQLAFVWSAIINQIAQLYLLKGPFAPKIFEEDKEFITSQIQQIINNNSHE